MHIVYYNFPVFGKSSSKVTKTIADKINILYANGTFKKTDKFFFHSVLKQISKIKYIPFHPSIWNTKRQKKN